MSDSHFERLLAELGERAGAELEQARADAQTRADEILGAAEVRVAKRRDDALVVREAEYARRGAAAAADARHAARASLLRAQHALVAMVIERARAIVVERLEHDGDSPALAARIAELSSYATNGTVTRRDGLELVANEGRLVIDDSVGAWLAGERAQIAIDVCRAVEAA